MEVLNKHNYEACFLDFLDGNLTEKELKDLSRFLQQNPDLKEELESFEEINLIPSDIKFENKYDLIKKTQAQHFEITEFEYLCVAKLENDINEEESRQLNSDLKNTINKNDYKKYEFTKLSANKNILFSNKNKLLKKHFYADYRTIISAVSAAAILLFFVIEGNFITFKSPENINKQIASNEKISKPFLKNTNLLKSKINLQEQTTVTHNQTIKNSNKLVLAFEDNEPQKIKDLYKELIVSIPDIKNEALISNTGQSISQNYVPVSYASNNSNTPKNKKDRFWKYAETGVQLWKKITKDDDIDLKNSYSDNGSVNEVNLIASNFQFRKTFNKK